MGGVGDIGIKAVEEEELAMDGDVGAKVDVEGLRL